MNRTPYLVAGAMLAALFAWQSCILLVREPAHPKAALQDDDYPLERGLTWVYKTQAGLQVVRRVYAPGLDSREIPLDSWWEMQFQLPFLGRQSLLMRRTQEGVLGRREDREQLIMRFPMKPGDSWTIDFPKEDLAVCTVLEPENVVVMGKNTRVSKLQVVRTKRKSGKVTTDYEWYARGIGLVQLQVSGVGTFALERFEKAE